MLCRLSYPGPQPALRRIDAADRPILGEVERTRPRPQRDSSRRAARISRLRSRRPAIASTPSLAEREALRGSDRRGGSAARRGSARSRRARTRPPASSTSMTFDLPAALSATCADATAAQRKPSLRAHVARRSVSRAGQHALRTCRAEAAVRGASRVVAGAFRPWRRASSERSSGCVPGRRPCRGSRSAARSRPAASRSIPPARRAAARAPSVGRACAPSRDRRRIAADLAADRFERRPGR